MSYIEDYTERIKQRGNIQLAEAIQETVSAVVPKYIDNFDYMNHVVSLLFGNVQSGKTSHMFGLIAAAADAGFSIFVVLTTDNIILQQQTLTRVLWDFPDFDVCGEDDSLRFSVNKLRKPSIIILKKNKDILRNWKNIFATSDFCVGNPLFIIDDEADAASPNTLVNKQMQSAINKNLEEIKKTSSSSTYLQVTGTPQALLLQTAISGWKPYFIHYFAPGKGYLGGDFFFQDENPYVIPTDNNEAKELLSDDEFPENKLKTALLTHLISSAHIFLNEIDKVANFLIHPSVKTSEHKKFAEKVGEYLNELASSIDEDVTLDALKSAYDDLLNTQSDLIEFDRAVEFIEDLIENDKVSIQVLNSKEVRDIDDSYLEGVNILIGGNSLGRGVTFDKLQTIYYCRQVKSPQADTMWQHSRMFGYDRVSGLMRVFMPPILIKKFSEINTTNNSLIAQVKKYQEGKPINLFYPNGIKPTRKPVINTNSLNMMTGGVNYFPFYPSNKSIETLDRMLEKFDDTASYSVNLNLISAIIKQFDTDPADWNAEGFVAFIESFIANKPSLQGRLLVRRERDIAKGTGTLLSPNDRDLGQNFSDEIVLILYKITGNMNKGWNGQKLWIPNIKFPDDIVFYSMKN